MASPIRHGEDRGQRWVKITHFRNLDLLKTEAASFPLDVISLLLKKTAAQFPTDSDVEVRVTESQMASRADLPGQSELSRRTALWPGPARRK